MRCLGELLSAGLPTLLLVLGFHRVQQLPHDAAVLAASHTAIVSLQTYVMIQPMASAGDCVCSESSSTTAKTKGPRHGPEHESAVATPGYPASLVTGVAGKELASAYTSCAKPQLDLHVIASNCLSPHGPGHNGDSRNSSNVCIGEVWQQQPDRPNDPQVLGASGRCARLPWLSEELFQR